MLAYVSLDEPGAADALLRDVASTLQENGWKLAGAVQRNPDGGVQGRCHMDLQDLTGNRVMRISQDLGALSEGCRLSPEGLEAAVGFAEAALDEPLPTDLVIVNKFGKQEVDGRGFRPLIGRALARDIPVLTAVGRGNLPSFECFAGGLAQPIAPVLKDVVEWAAMVRPKRAPRRIFVR